MPGKKFLIIAALALASLFGAVAREARAMTISPTDFNFTVDPGDVIQDVLHVYNEDTHAVTLQPLLYNFTSRHEDESAGTPDFYPADETRDGHELAAWITLARHTPFTLSAGERISIPFTLAVPAQAQPGGHFGAVLVSTSQASRPGDGPQVGVAAAAAALIFVRVDGETRDHLAIESFSSNRFFQAHLPAEFTLRVSNEGTTHLVPAGTISIKDLFGRHVASLEVNSKEQRRVLPGATRRFEVSWLRERLPDNAPEYLQEWRNFAFGPYTATLLLAYGETGQRQLLTATTEFWVLPWRILSTLLAALAASVLVARFALKRYARSIIARHEARTHQQKPD